MSWFYEALSRAEKERSNGTDVSATGQNGGLFWNPIDPHSPESGESSKRQPGARSLAGVLTDEITAPAAVLESMGTKPSGGAQSRNGFRHITLPVREESRLVFRTDPRGLAAEQFRLLRRTLSQELGTGAVLMVTSPGVGDGKTLISMNLSACLADLGEPTLFVEADVRRPTARRILGCALEPPGIEDALSGKVEPSQTINLIEELSLHAAMVAKVPPDPFHVINGAGVKQFLAWARENFRWVVLDTAPVLPAADVAELLPFADAVLLVVRAQTTPRELSKRAVEMLGKRLHGVIFNGATVDSNTYYSYLDQQYLGAGSKKAQRPRAQ